MLWLVSLSDSNRSIDRTFCQLAAAFFSAVGSGDGVLTCAFTAPGAKKTVVAVNTITKRHENSRMRLSRHQRRCDPESSLTV